MPLSTRRTAIGRIDMTVTAVVLLACFVPAVLMAQTNPAAAAARVWRQQHERAIVDEFVTLRSIPNIARDKDNIQRNAQAISAMMARRGLSPRP